MRIKITFLLVLVAFSSCIESVDYELDQYVKVLSLDRSSYAEKVIELDNGDLIILGEMGMSAFEQESTSQGQEANVLEDQAPFIAITDANGNLKNIKLFPMEETQANSPMGPIEILNENNTTTFHNLIQTTTGDYIVHAQSLGFDFIHPLTGQLIRSEPDNQNYSDLLYKLNPSLNVEEVISMQGYPGWDGVARFRGKLKRVGENSLGFILSQRIPLFAIGGPSVDLQKSTGFTFSHLNEDLDTLAYVDVGSTTDLIGYDFTLDDHGKLTILTTGERTFQIWSESSENLQNGFTKTPIVGKGILNTQNRDENFLELLPDGSFVIVYTQPPFEIFLEHRAPDMSILNTPAPIGQAESYQQNTVRATRSLTITSDNHLLIYVLVIPGDTGERLSGELFKTSLDGNIIFRKEIQGVPGDVIETQDGSYVTVSNRAYNGSLQKIHITKMNSDGELY